MKKVFMSAAIVALMVTAVACGSNNNKKAEKADAEAPKEEQVDPVKEAAKEAGDAIKDAATEKVIEGINAAGDKAVDAIKNK